MGLDLLDSIGAQRLKSKILEIFKKHSENDSIHITDLEKNKISKVPDDIEGLLNQKSPTSHTHTKIQDSGDGRDITFKYSADDLGTAQWFGAWDGGELRAISATGLRNSIDAAQTNHGKHVPNTCSETLDWNTATTTGWYMGNSSQNAPSAGWFFGNVIAHNENYLVQEVYAFTSITNEKNVPKYIRVRLNGTWNSWIDVTVHKAVPVNAVFTDTNDKVTQTAVSNNTNYPLLLAPQTSNATTSVYFDSSVTLNPYTNTINANIIASNVNTESIFTKASDSHSIEILPPLPLLYGNFYTYDTLAVDIHSSVYKYGKIMPTNTMFKYCDGDSCVGGSYCGSSANCCSGHYDLVFLFRIIGYDEGDSANAHKPFVKEIPLSTSVSQGAYGTDGNSVDFKTEYGNNIRLRLTGTSGVDCYGNIQGNPILYIDSTYNVHFTEISLVS